MRRFLNWCTQKFLDNCIYATVVVVAVLWLGLVVYISVQRKVAGAPAPLPRERKYGGVYGLPNPTILYWNVDNRDVEGATYHYDFLPDGRLKGSHSNRAVQWEGKWKAWNNAGGGIILRVEEPVGRGDMVFWYAYLNYVTDDPTYPGMRFYRGITQGAYNNVKIDLVIVHTGKPR